MFGLTEGKLHITCLNQDLNHIPPKYNASLFGYAAVPPYPWVMCSETYRGHMKPWIIPNAIYNTIFV
jgi:hypothetical protein